MGFLDKAKNIDRQKLMERAKSMAEQAQTKLDDVQKDFAAKQAGTAPADGPAVQYDSAGRPIQAGAPPEVPVEPSATGAPAPSMAEPPPADLGEAPAAAATPPPAAPPDPEATPGLTSGDPLAG